MVSSLSQKKYRDKEGCFTAEGTKCVHDTCRHFGLRALIATPQWLDGNGDNWPREAVYEATRAQMARMSQFSTPSEVIAVYRIPQRDWVDEEVRGHLNIVLEDVQDPGNMGTIIRLADWYGIRHIFCSRGTVDVYGHKVVQATMGAIARVAVHYCQLEQLLQRYKDMPAYGTSLDGENIYSARLGNSGFVVFGNEGNGMSAELKALTTKNLFIPSPALASGNDTSESLNVGVAAAITISEFCRNALKLI